LPGLGPLANPGTNDKRIVDINIIISNDVARRKAVYQSSSNPNVRVCVRFANLAQTEQDVLGILRLVR
jgi:hypothetical protein